MPLSDRDQTSLGEAAARNRSYLLLHSALIRAEAPTPSAHMFTALSDAETPPPGSDLRWKHMVCPLKHQLL